MLQHNATFLLLFYDVTSHCFLDHCSIIDQYETENKRGAHMDFQMTILVVLSVMGVAQIVYLGFCKSPEQEFDSRSHSHNHDSRS